ncbi:hypothetical protein MN608_05421 [Microdochium nivale]|nr:hypothetical protein MN608_05421 [Microdochium nivale]
MEMCHANYLGQSSPALPSRAVIDSLGHDSPLSPLPVANANRNQCDHVWGWCDDAIDVVTARKARRHTRHPSSEPASKINLTSHPHRSTKTVWFFVLAIRLVEVEQKWESKTESERVSASVRLRPWARSGTGFDEMKQISTDSTVLLLHKLALTPDAKLSTRLDTTVKPTEIARYCNDDQGGGAGISINTRSCSSDFNRTPSFQQPRSQGGSSTRYQNKRDRDTSRQNACHATFVVLLGTPLFC